MTIDAADFGGGFGNFRIFPFLSIVRLRLKLQIPSFEPARERSPTHALFACQRASPLGLETDQVIASGFPGRPSEPNKSSRNRRELLVRAMTRATGEC